MDLEELTVLPAGCRNAVERNGGTWRLCWPGCGLQCRRGLQGRESPGPGAGGVEAAGQWLDWALQRLGLALIANHFVKMNEENAAVNRVPTEENN